MDQTLGRSATASAAFFSALNKTEENSSSNQVDNPDDKADPLLQNSVLMVTEAWDSLRRSMLYLNGDPVGSIAALDSSTEKLNYDQVTACSHDLLTVMVSCFSGYIFSVSLSQLRI